MTEQEDMELIEEAQCFLEMTTNDFIESVLDTVCNQAFLSKRQRNLLEEFVTEQRSKMPC